MRNVVGNMVSPTLSPVSLHLQALDPDQTLAVGKLGGRQVMPLPEALQVTPTPAGRYGSETTPALSLSSVESEELAPPPPPPRRVRHPSVNSVSASPPPTFSASSKPPELVRHARYEVLPSAQQLSESAGIQHEGEYSGVMGFIFELLCSLPLLGTLLDDKDPVIRALSKYHASHARASEIQGPGSAKHARNALVRSLDLLDNLDRRAQVPEEANAQRNLAIADLRSMIVNERKVITALLDEMEQGGELPSRSTLSNALAFARMGISLKDTNRLLSKGLEPEQANVARILIDAERLSAVLEGNEPSTYSQTDFTTDEIFWLEFSGLGREGGALYRELGIPINRQTVVTTSSSDYQLGHMENLGSGALHTVLKVRYVREGGGVAEGVFKPLSNVENGWVAKRIGVNLALPQIANRNLATQEVARALGFDVIVDSQIGSCRRYKLSSTTDAALNADDWAEVSHSLQIGLVMGVAPGEQALKSPKSHFQYPEVKREITKLQLLDHIVGQGDRHPGNYFIHVTEDSEGNVNAKVSGIDNDQCFGKNTLTADGVRHRNSRAFSGFRGTGMPPAVDSEMSTAVRALTRERLADILSDKLLPEEVFAAQSRLESLQNHIDQLEWEGRIFDTTEWNKQQYVRLFDASDSYFARDAFTAQKIY